MSSEFIDELSVKKDKDPAYQRILIDRSVNEMESFQMSMRVKTETLVAFAKEVLETAGYKVLLGTPNP